MSRRECSALSLKVPEARFNQGFSWFGVPMLVQNSLLAILIPALISLMSERCFFGGVT